MSPEEDLPPQKTEPSLDSLPSPPGADHPSASDRHMVLLTAVIAICTLVYSIFAGLQWWEINTGSSDTHALAVAAQTQATRMAESLERTDRLVSATADQVKAANALAAQAQRANEIASRALAQNERATKDSQRPWVGLKEFRCEDCSFGVEGPIMIGNMIGLLENSGKTPALQLSIRVATSMQNGTSPVPTFEELRGRLISDFRFSEEELREIAGEQSLTNPPFVLPPNASRLVTITRGVLIGRRDGFPRPERSKRGITYMLGHVTYSGPDRRNVYVTEFCVMADEGMNGFSFCPTGNDMR